MTVREMAVAARQASYRLATLDAAAKNAALTAIAERLEAERAQILAANRADLAQAQADQVAAPLVQRLSIENKLDQMIAGVHEVARLPDPVGKVLQRRQLDQGLELTRVSVPIGVLGIVFESRPDALVQIAALCIKSGNAAILKGGSEAQRSNAALFGCIEAALAAQPALAGALHLAATRAEIHALLELDELVDLLIPRGSNELVRSIQAATKIPVMGHADGICHVYVDAAADLPMALQVVADAKLQYPAVCNATETLLVHADVAAALLPALAERLTAAGVELRGDPRTCAIIDAVPAVDADWDAEYLDLVLAIRIVDGLDEAIGFINEHGSHHTDAIVTAARDAAERFLSQVDSATVLWNASTRFADGYRFGMGAEVGISTNRIHARGPVGLDGLVTYKYRVVGNGHVVDDYVSGARRFAFAELPLDADPPAPATAATPQHTAAASRR